MFQLLLLCVKNGFVFIQMILMIHLMILLRPHSVTRPLQVTIGIPHPSKKQLVHTIRRVELVGFDYVLLCVHKQFPLNKEILFFTGPSTTRRKPKNKMESTMESAIFCLHRQLPVLSARRMTQSFNSNCRLPSKPTSYV